MERSETAQDALRPRMRSAAAAPSASASASRRRRASSASASSLARRGGHFGFGFGAGTRHDLGALVRAPPGASRPSAGRSRRAPRPSSARTPPSQPRLGAPTVAPARAPTRSRARAAAITRSTGLNSSRFSTAVSSSTKKMTQRTRQIREHDTSEARFRSAQPRAFAANTNINLYHSRRDPAQRRNGAAQMTYMAASARATARADRALRRRPPRPALPQPHPRAAGSQREQQPAGGLRVEQQVDEVGLDPGARPRRRRQSASRLVRPPPGMLPRTSARAPSRSGTRPASISSEHRSPPPSPTHGPIRPNPVTSVHACTAPPAAARAPRGRPVQRRHRRTAPSTAPAGARSNLSAVAMTPVPIGLVRISTSPGDGAGIGQTRAGSISPVTA